MNKTLQVSSRIRTRCCIMLMLEQEINIQNMNIELVAQMFKNYQSNVLFHLEGRWYSNNELRKHIRKANRL